MVPSSLFCFLCLQISLVSSVHPDTRGAEVFTYLGSLVQLCCGWGGTLQTNITGVCGECVPCMDYTGFATAQGGMCFLGLHCSGSRVLCRGTVQSRPCILCTSRSKLLRFSGTLQGHRLGGARVLCPSQVRAAQATRCLANALSQVGHAS